MIIRINCFVKKIVFTERVQQRVMILDTKMIIRINCIIKKIARMYVAILIDFQIRFRCTTLLLVNVDVFWLFDYNETFFSFLVITSSRSETRKTLLCVWIVMSSFLEYFEWLKHFVCFLCISICFIASEFWIMHI